MAMMSLQSSEPSFNLARYCLAERAELCPDKVALVFVDSLSSDQEEFTYSQIEDKALRFGGWLLSNNYQKGSRIFIRLKTGPHFVAAFFGAIAVGMVPVPLSPLLTHIELDRFARHVGPQLMIIESDVQLEALKKLAPVMTSQEFSKIIESGPRACYEDTRLDDPAFMVFTSGTSGHPKCVVHGQRVVLGRQPMFEGWTDIKQNDRVLHAGSLNWTYSLGVGLLDVFAASATAIFYTGEPSPKLWPEVIGSLQASIFAAVPSLYRRLLKYGDLLKIKKSALRHGLCAGEPLPAKLYDKWVESTDCPLYEALGMSEISTYISSSPHVKTRPGSPGKPQPGRRICLIRDDQPDEGRPFEGQGGIIAVHRSDPGLFLGYFKDGEIHPPDLHKDWFVTGDLARFDADGYVWFGGRSDDIMNPSGYRVSPVEVEQVLSQAKKSMDIAVGEIEVGEGLRHIFAFAVLAPQANKKEAQIELEHLGAQLASYKRPRQIIFVDKLPRTANGKIQRAELPRFVVKTRFKA